MGIFYLSTKFELDRFTNNEDLLSDRNHKKHTQTDTQTESDTLPIYDIGSSNDIIWSLSKRERERDTDDDEK